MATRARAARLAAEAAAARLNNEEQEGEGNPPRDEPPPRDNDRNDNNEDDDLQADDEQRNPRQNEPPQDDSDQGTEVMEDEDESTVVAPTYRPLTSPMELVDLGSNVQTRVITVHIGLSTWKNSWGIMCNESRRMKPNHIVMTEIECPTCSRPMGIRTASTVYAVFAP